MNDARINALLDDVMSAWTVEEPPEDFATRVVVEPKEPPMQIADPSPPPASRVRPWLIPTVGALVAAAAVWLWQRPSPKVATPRESIAVAEVPPNAPREEDTWCDIESAFRRSFADGYPFNPDGEPVELDALTDFYHPQKGRLWRYYARELEGTIPRKEGVFVLEQEGDYDPSVVEFLQASERITSSMFPPGSDRPRVDFAVVVRGSPKVRQVNLDVDGDVVRYRNGPLERVEMTWPGEGTPRAKLEMLGLARKDSLEFPGPWGLFQLLETGKLQRSTEKENSFRAQWDFSDSDLGLEQIDFSLQRGDSPFYGAANREGFLAVFRNDHVRPPRSLVSGAQACPE